MMLTLSVYLFCGFMYLLGQAAHLFFIKMPSLKEKTHAVNKAFYFSDWWDCDWNIIIGGQVLGIAIVIGLPEILSWKPFIWDYIRWFFFFIGAFNSVIFMALFSKYSKQITALSDIKSNIADMLPGGVTTTVKATLEKGKEVTGQDVSQLSK